MDREKCRDYDILHFIAFIALAAFPSWHDEAANDDLFPSRLYAMTAQLGCAAAAFFALISAVWQHAAADAVGTIITATTFGYVLSETGAVAMALAWVSYVLLVIIFTAILAMRISMQKSEDME